MMKMFRTHAFTWMAVLALLAPALSFAQNSYYFPQAGDDFDPVIPTPEQFLGYPIGSHYTRHDQIVAYFRELARLSDKVAVFDTGQSYERRPLIAAAITSSANQSQLETLRQQHASLVDPSQPQADSANVPVVVGLYYSVHGAETSSGEAALLTAYYLAAHRGEDTARWLENAIVLIDPSQNPDGRDRTANWHNAWTNAPPVADPADREHVEPFPGGRFNHYLTDLNRDWLAATQQETRHKLDFFHQWYPNVQIDFHEMGGNSTYYFEPSPSSMHSPLLPQASYDFNVTLARYHAQALDALGSLYFTREVFDNFSPVYGSTYPDFHGAVGVTVEQGSSRGRVLEVSSGTLEFPFTVRNQVATGIATVRGAVAEQSGLFTLQKSFYRSAVEQGQRYPVKTLVFGDAHDATLSRRLLDLLLLHRIQVHELSADVTLDGRHYRSGSAWAVPVAQPQFRLVHAIFEATPEVRESVYGSTSYAIAPAYGLHVGRSQRALPLGTRILAPTPSTGRIDAQPARYAYVIDWRDYNAFPALYRLLDAELSVRATFQPFTLSTRSGEREFARGSLVIPVAGQPLEADALHALFKGITVSTGLSIHSVDTGLSRSGVDLGSNNVRVLRKPSVALLVGQGVNPTEIGSTWFALSEHVRLPATKLEPAQLASVDLSRYTSLVIASGNYAELNEASVKALTRWVQAGGSLITFGNASQWAIERGLSTEKLRVQTPEKEAPVLRRDFADLATWSGDQRIAGNLFSADIDITHPLAFGVAERSFHVNKNALIGFEPSQDPFSTVVRIEDTPVVHGFLPGPLREQLSGAAWAVVGGNGLGNVVLFADDPAHRKYWQGTERLLLNAIFFANHLRPPPRR